jgi:hypothetical protein
VDTLRNSNAFELSETQILMLQLSETDIENGKLIAHEQVDQQDLEWLKDLLSF